MERFNFVDDDLISIESTHDQDKIIPVSEEVNRGGAVYNTRLRNKLARKDVKPLYDAARKKKEELSKIAIYKLYCTFPKPLTPYTTEYPECEHKGNIIIDRDVLPKEEHIELLALPKIRPDAQEKKKRQCHFEKKYLPNCTAHIESLAVPNKRKIMMTLQTFSEVLSPSKVDFLCDLLNRDKKDLRSIENAVELRQEELKRNLAKKARIRKKAAQVKRKLNKLQKNEVRDIVNTIYEVMKKFLMTDHNMKLSKGLKNLSDVLEWKIKEFLGMSQPCDLENTFIKVLADNLAIWMEKFLSNFGFQCICEYPQPTAGPCPCIQKELQAQIPIEDYIEVSEEEEAKTEFEVEEQEEEEGEEEDARSKVFKPSTIEEIIDEGDIEEGTVEEAEDE